MCTSTNSGQFDIQHRLIGFFYNRYGECLLRGTDGIFKYNCVKKTNLMHNLFLVYFVNLYMFLAYLGPSSGGTTVYVQQLVLILFRWLSVVLIVISKCRSTKHNTLNKSYANYRLWNDRAMPQAVRCQPLYEDVHFVFHVIPWQSGSENWLSAVIIVTLMLSSLRHPHFTVTRRTNERSLGTF